MTKENSDSKIQIGKRVYESPRVERVEVQTEGGFATSVVKDNNATVTLDDWTKTTGSDSNTWSD